MQEYLKLSMPWMVANNILFKNMFQAYVLENGGLQGSKEVRFQAAFWFLRRAVVIDIISVGG